MGQSGKEAGLGNGQAEFSVREMCACLLSAAAKSDRTDSEYKITLAVHSWEYGLEGSSQVEGNPLDITTTAVSTAFPEPGSMGLLGFSLAGLSLFY